MKVQNLRIALIGLTVLCRIGGPAAVPAQAQDGAALFKTWCSTCHEADAEARAPSRDILQRMSPEQILQSLEKGAMLAQGAERSRAERRVLAEYLSEKRFGSEPISPIPQSAFCGGSPNALSGSLTGPAWNGWGVSTANSRFQPGDAAGLAAADVPRLKLKWAFGFPGASSAGAQPVVVGGRVYVSSWEGEVYSLDAKTGCIQWMMETEAGVRSAISIWKGKNGAPVAYFGDLAANIYAADAATGKQLWKVKVDDYPLARITGSPTLYEGRLYVPVASREESQAADPRFVCCRFRGSVVALDAASGKRIWKTYTISEVAHPTTKSRVGVQLWGPSGAAVWSAPTVDPKRKAIYFGTGNAYSSPQVPTSDSIFALDMKTGKILWVRQLTDMDMWNGSCPDTARDHANCSQEDAPDFDFAASPILVERKGGRRALIAGQKSGLVFALDPDAGGKVVWQQRVGKGGISGGILWGPAADHEAVYVAISDQTKIKGKLDTSVGGGLAAVSLDDGRKRWSTPHPACGDRKNCSPVQAAAVSAIPGVVFSGSNDGHLRAYSTADGKIVWDYDTAHEFTTVDGVKANGGSLNNGGPAIAGGMLFTNSGYSHHSGILPGNVLLAFAVE